MKKGLQNEVHKKVFFVDFRYFFEFWVQRCPRVVPGTLPGSLQGQICSKMGLKMTPKSSKILPAGFLKTLLKDTRTEHVSKQLWFFFQFVPIHSYSCRGRFCVTFIQGKSRHSSTWLGGKTYGGCLPDASKMPPDVSMMPPGCLHMTPRCFPQDALSLARAYSPGL